MTRRPPAVVGPRAGTAAVVAGPGAGVEARRRLLARVVAHVVGGPVRIRHGLGPPEVVDHPDLRCSLADSGATSIAAVSRGPIGIDVEDPRLPRRLERVAARMCSAAEAVELAAVHRDRTSWEAAVLRGWVRKEALAKGLGTGLGVPLATLDVGVGPTPRVSVAAGGRSWQVLDLPIGTCLAAVAVPTGTRVQLWPSATLTSTDTR